MDLEFVKAFQQLSNPLFDWFFYLVTQIGDQYVFIVIAAILYWTLNKKYAHAFVLAFLISAIFNASLKEIFQRPRPFTQEGVRVPDLPGVETPGYSFPSGHSQAAGVIGYTMLEGKRRTNLSWLMYSAIFILIFVPLSRVYLGQHYLSDVIVGTLIGLLSGYAVFKLSPLLKDKEHMVTLYLLAIIPPLLLFVTDRNLVIAAGGMTGFAIGYAVEKLKVCYEVKAPLWVQIVKVVTGLVVAILIKEGLKFVFPDTNLFDFFRYFLIGIWAALGAPWVFKHVLPYHQKNV